MQITIQSELNEDIVLNENDVTSLIIDSDFINFGYKLKIKMTFNFENYKESYLKFYEYFEKQITFKMIIETKDEKITGVIIDNLNIKSIDYELDKSKFVLFINNKNYIDNLIKQRNNIETKSIWDEVNAEIIRLLRDNC